MYNEINKGLNQAALLLTKGMIDAQQNNTMRREQPDPQIVGQLAARGWPLTKPLMRYVFDFTEEQKEAFKKLLAETTALHPALDEKQVFQTVEKLVLADLYPSVRNQTYVHPPIIFDFLLEEPGHGVEGMQIRLTLPVQARIGITLMEAATRQQSREQAFLSSDPAAVARRRLSYAATMLSYRQTADNRKATLG